MTLQDNKNALDRRGLTRMDAFLPQSDVRLARELILGLASDHGLYSSSGWAHSDSRFGVDKSFRDALKALNASDHFPDFISKTLLEIAAELVGETVTPLPPGQQILFSLPDSPTWSVPHNVWHVDVPRLGALGQPGLQMFTFLDDVEPRGGGTLVLAGSHRLLNTSRSLRSKDLKRALAKADYFRRLFDGGRPPITDLNETAGAVADVDLEVVELTGQAGDIYLMDLRTLHAPAPNAAKTARIMLTCRLPRTCVAPALVDQSLL
ncbi:phytanoyl-CoA dioxygenase family protein [Algimonas porphyrae]|uniref:Phytanoyl-CoA dioxygenase (PhyH) n=1 Tax=Algimonas porphyrae TaxID=1128113 RepID=A0ABQ5V4H3_9PROT|nr:phytanoyl-CoA dioxygenase family protein [Algimonas porphyrae]GLQ21887.1 hypothetical protein GCM10007854_28420 [Algimonas porphyrae]